jgi:AraC-like DNA-binding protein
VKEIDNNYYPTLWHYHPEYEIVLVTESTGKRFIGDHLSEFQPGNLALIGPNLPHYYRNEDKYLAPGATLHARAIVVHFTEASLGEDLLNLPEAARLRKLFERSVCGLDVIGPTQKKVSQKLHDIVQLSGMRRWLCLIDILQDIAESKSLTPIARASFVGYNQKESTRLSDVFDWIYANFESNIRLSEAATIAEMQENAFSRFFSQRTHKTFSKFVQELRLQKAIRMLEKNEIPITEICYECGFNNISNFNRQFLNQYGVSPSRYRHKATKGK